MMIKVTDKSSIHPAAVILWLSLQFAVQCIVHYLDDVTPVCHTGACSLPRCQFTVINFTITPAFDHWLVCYYLLFTHFLSAKAYQNQNGVYVRVDSICCYKMIFGLSECKWFFVLNINTCTRGHAFKLLIRSIALASELLFFCERVVNSQYNLHSNTGFSSLSVFKRSVSNIDGDRAFLVAALRVWNSLPHHVTSAQSLTVFRSRL